MKTSSRCLRGLMGSVLAVALIAPPAYPQNTQAQLNQLTTDVLNLTNAVKMLQVSADQRNVELTITLEKIVSRFGAIEGSFQRLDGAISSLRTDNEKTSQQSVQDVRTAVNSLKDTFAESNKTVQEELTLLKNQVSSVRKQLTDMQTTESPLPTAAQMFNDAWASYNQGFYDLAISGLREFLRTYPKDARAQLAQITIGESLSAQKKFDQALLEYEMASQSYPEGDKKCLALYKRGRTLVELKQNPQATAAYNSVVKDCPGTSEAASATEDLKGLPRRR